MPQAVSAKDKIRGAIFSAKKKRQIRETFNVEGEEFDVLFIEPTYDERKAGLALLEFDSKGSMKKDSQLDTAKVAIIVTAHVPETGEKLFDVMDMSSLGSLQPSFVDAMTVPALQLFSGSVDDEKKD